MIRLLSTGFASLGLAACAVSIGSSGLDGRDGIVRTYGSPTSPIAQSLVIPAGYETVRLSGVVPEALPGGGYGDTEQQTANVLSRIETVLRGQGLGHGDVVAMTVYLVRPEGASGMDFAGMMRAYGRAYGTAEQPNRPVRSTVEVAGLVRPGMLVEIEVTAARKPN